MNNNNKVVVLVVGGIVALLALSYLVRFVMLSQAGVSTGWIYLGLPVGGIGVLIAVLLRLGLLNLGQRPGGTSRHWQHDISAHTPQYPAPYTPPVAPQPPVAPPAAAAPAYQRLQELETMRASGAISEAEYAAKRQQIISTI